LVGVLILARMANDQRLPRWGLRVLLAAGAEPDRVRIVVRQLLSLLD
jgi:hypothetical protein